MVYMESRGCRKRTYLLRVVGREQQAISITSIPYIRRRSCRKTIWLWVEIGGSSS
jgi:hypothetical protein